MLPNNFDALDEALLGPSFDVTSDELIAVKAEDIQQGSDFDYSKHFFEPQPGSSYLIKFLPNPRDVKGLITHRSLYRSLPDPDRRGKTFRYISSGSANTCKVLSLFFDLNDAKKSGDAIAKAKIDKYLARTQQACTLVQILSSPNKEEIGQVRLFVYSTFGPNAHIANLINQKLNPTKAQIDAGFEREDIFNIFESSVLSVICEEANYNGVKGRDYSKSVWAPKPKGAFVQLEDGSIHTFSKADIQDGKLVESVIPAFTEFKKVITNEDYDVKKHFAYKEVTDPTLDEETLTYLKQVNDKVDRVVEIIRNKSLAEIAMIGKVEEGDNTEQGSVLQNSIPEELKDVLGAETSAETKSETSTTSVDDELAGFLD